MTKLISSISMFLFPVIASAHGFMMNSFDGGWGSGYDHFGGAMFGAFLLIPLVGIIFAVSAFAFWVMMLIDAIKHTSEKTKLVWVVVIVFTHIIGALIYYFVEKRPKNKHNSEHTDHKE